MKKQKIIIILGQTSTGKSDLAVHIAKKIKGEVISADSRQVYKGLDLGTGKITKKEMQGIPHYMLDVESPKKKFSITKWQSMTNQRIEEMVSLGKTPIVCGGTGFYIDALVNNVVFPEVPPNKKLREDLNKKNATQLFKMLQRLDNIRAKNIDPHNKVRLIRAIEIIKKLGKVPKIKTEENKYEFIKIGLYLDDETLKKNIKERLTMRLKKGMMREAKKLHRGGLSWKRMKELGLEYRHMALYLEGKMTRVEMVKKLNSEIIQYSKRQKTWWKRDPKITWFKPTEIKKIEKHIKKELKG